MSKILKMDFPPGQMKLKFCAALTGLKGEINGLEKKRKVMEGHMRRCNVRILGIS